MATWTKLLYTENNERGWAFLNHTIALAVGFLLDFLLGDPLWLPHPVVAMGKLITWLEKLLRCLFPKTPRGELAGGILLAVVLPLLSWGVSFACLWLLCLVHPLLCFAAECWMCYQVLAARGLAQASKAVFLRLAAGDLPGARKAVGRIVGRDTKSLTAEGVTRAAVETVAENSSDGVIAPMFFLALGGAPLGMFYKAINTMDSMVGYKNDRYRFFGKAAARLDDAADFLPARLSALLTVLAAGLSGFSLKNAWRIFRRDRHNHASPNSAQTESVYAGALGVQLAGDTSYFGKLVRKPTIGDRLRPIEPRDILRANRLLWVTTMLSLMACILLRMAIFIGMGGSLL